MINDWKVGIDYPEWGNNTEYLQTIKGGYLRDNETPKQAYQRVSKAAADNLKRPDLESQFFNALWNNWICLSSPILANLGAKKGLPISCFGSYVEDDFYEIVRKGAETMFLSQNGGGTSAVFNIRGNGEPISGGGFSDGVIPFLNFYDAAVLTSKQLPVRRGAFAAYLNINHKDILDFLNVKSRQGDIRRNYMQLNPAVLINDDFMKSLTTNKANDDLFKKMLKTRISKGTPYITYIDNANNQRWWKDIKPDLTIKGSNLCVAPETQILTKEGYITIGENENKEVEVWNGYEWSKTRIVKTGTNQKLIKITFNNGSVIECTEYHKFYLKTKSFEIVSFLTSTHKINITKEVRAIDLKKGDEIQDFTLDNNTISGIKVVKVEDANRFDDTYCVNEPIEHKAVFNGILTGNCNEIYLPSDKDHTFVCCLLSLNVRRYDEWKGTNTVQLAAYFLDAVLTEFIEKGKKIKGIEDAVRFAEKSRSIGTGILGYHSYLQEKMIPLESITARHINKEIFSYIHSELLIATKKLAVEYGEPEWLIGTGRRNLTLEAVAPTISNSKLSSASMGIEPYESNYYSENTDKGTFETKNPIFEDLLISKKKNDYKVWESIKKNRGSIQHLDFLSKEEKAVFRTFKEINQKELIHQASERQPFIEQGQSLNLSFFIDVKLKFVYECHIEAWEKGLKGLYYYRNEEQINEKFLNNLKTNQVNYLESTYSNCAVCEA